MPIVVQETFPAYKTLRDEGLFLMKEKRAIHQDIRPLKILILNLMPLKVVTETQILRLLSNSLIQVQATFIHPKTYKSKNTDKSHLETFYKTYDDIKTQRFDGMIVTGAPVEQLSFEDVDYWNELTDILNFSDSNVTSTIYICWGAQAALYHFYNINKYPLSEKQFGIFEHQLLVNIPLVQGFDELFLAPHSRHTMTRKEDIINHSELSLLAESKEAGAYIMTNKDSSKIFVTGHCEYDYDSLDFEYKRDLNKGLEIKIPRYYYKDDNPNNKPLNRWRGHANLLFSNWLNYYVYQVTDYDL